MSTLHDFNRFKFFKYVAVLLICYGLMAGVAHAEVDWVVNVEADVNAIPARGTVEYRVRVDNGTDTGTNAEATTIDLSIPDTGVYTGVSGSFSGCTAAPVTGNAIISCTVPALNDGGSAEAVFSVQLLEQGSPTFTATIPAADDDPDNNKASVTTTVTAGADMALTIAGPVTVASGASIDYTLTATNNGPDPATNVQISFPVPAGISNITPPAGCSLGGDTYTCLLAGPIADGDAVSRIFSGQVAAAATLIDSIMASGKNG